MPNSIRLLNDSFLQFKDALLPKDIYKATVKEAKKISKADAGSIFLHTGEEFQRLYSCVPKSKQGIPSPRGLAYKALKTGKSYIHTKRSVAKNHPELFKNGVKSIAVIPLVHQDDMLGILALQTYSNRQLRKDILPVLQLFGTVAGLTIYRTKKLYESQDILKSRDLFMSVASHEIKNPLTTIHMYSQMLDESIKKNVMPPIKWANILGTEINQLTQLINDLLTKEKMSLYDMDYDWKVENIKRSLLETLEKYQTTHPNRQLTYRDETNEEVINLLFDSNKMQQVFNNLLNNAVKFSPISEPILITIASTPKYVVTKITDKGKGIPSANKRKLFEKFYKGDSRKEGMGLGLYVAKTIIDKHHGKIRVQSHINKGTTIQISLPRVHKKQT